MHCEPVLSLRPHSRGLLIVALFLYPVLGCDSGSSSVGTLTVIVDGWNAEADARVSLEGVELCEAGTPNCATTNADGVGSIDLPIDEEITYTLVKEGYASYLFADIVPASGFQLEFLMLTDELLASQYERLMSSYPPEGEGEIAIELHPTFAGVTFDLETSGKGYYVDETEAWSSDLTETSSEGRGGFLEVEPGSFQIELGGTAEGCAAGLAWPGNVENSIRVPVLEGHRTFATANCSTTP